MTLDDLKSKMDDADKEWYESDRMLWSDCEGCGKEKWEFCECPWKRWRDPDAFVESHEQDLEMIASGHRNSDFIMIAIHHYSIEFYKACKVYVIARDDSLSAALLWKLQNGGVV